MTGINHSNQSDPTSRILAVAFLVAFTVGLVLAVVIKGAMR